MDINHESFGEYCGDFEGGGASGVWVAYWGFDAAFRQGGEDLGVRIEVPPG